MFTANQELGIPTRSTMLLTLAAFLGLLTSTLLADTDQSAVAPPGLLPVGTHAASKPMASATAETVAGTLWQAIEGHDAGRFESAIAAWQRVDMPCENEAWRWLGRGVAHLYLGQLDNAADALALANKHDSQNAAVHYFRGLLRLEQAEVAHDYLDAVHFPDVRVVSHTLGSDPNPAHSGKSKSRYELEAIHELESAIEYASDIDLAAPLAPVRWVVAVPYPMAEPIAPPTVEDLLRALAADNFVGKAHGLLAHLYLDRERPQEAEHHVEQAGSHGISVPYGYRLVGELYEEHGRRADASRAYMKAKEGGDGLAGSGAQPLRNLGNALEELL